MIWKKRCFWAVICPMMYILVLLAVVPFVYGIVDDRTMMEVISGQYLGTPDAHGFFTGYWYPLLVALPCSAERGLVCTWIHFSAGMLYGTDGMEADRAAGTTGKPRQTGW